MQAINPMDQPIYGAPVPGQQNIWAPYETTGIFAEPQSYAVQPTSIGQELQTAPAKEPSAGVLALGWAYRILSIAGMTTGAYHGYKRNDSVGWAIGWAILGGLFPFITIPLSLAQGFGKPHAAHANAEDEP